MEELKNTEEEKIDWLQQYYKIQVESIKASLALAKAYADLYRSQRNYLEWAPKFARTKQKAALAMVTIVSGIFLSFSLFCWGCGDIELIELVSLFLEPWVWFLVGWSGFAMLDFGANRWADKIANKAKKEGFNLTIFGTYSLTTCCTVDGTESSSEYSFAGRKEEETND